MWWDIGGNIRSTAEHRLAVDMARCTSRMAGEVAPECRYHEAPPVASLVTPHGGIMADSHRYGLKYTGNYRVCAFNELAAEAEGGWELCSRKLAVHERLNKVSDDDLQPLKDSKGKPLVERSFWYPAAAVAAAPFDYAIDPALSLVTSPFAFLYVLVVNALP